MDRSIRYQLLPEEDESAAEPIGASESVEVEVEVLTDDHVVDLEPPQQSLTTVADPDTAAVGQKIPEPPSYSVATSLPSYEEAEQTKQSEEDLRQQDTANSQPAQSCTSSSNSTQRVGDIYLGTDGIFLCSFLVAFLFNCVGLFAILCVSQTIAARFGAVSGFGLSIVKYVAFMQYQNWVASWNDGFSWLWWFMLFLGLLMFFRGCMQYIRIKYQWAKLSQQMRGRIYLYF